MAVTRFDMACGCFQQDGKVEREHRSKRDRGDGEERKERHRDR